LLHAIHSPLYWRILKKIIIILTKIRETRKLRVENQTKTRVLTKKAVQEFHLWTACRYIYGLVRQEELVAFYRDAAIGLITPLRDGMNLVAKVWEYDQNQIQPFFVKLVDLILGHEFDKGLESLAPCYS
jgi:hypothetical protein